MPTFPVDLETWLTPFRVAEQTFDLGEGLSVQNRTAGGDVIRSGGAARLWHGSLTLTPMDNAEARSLEARLNALRGVGAYFTMRDYRFDTVITGTLAVQASGLVNITGGPANAAIRAGSYIGFEYAGRRALHQILTATTLNASGVRNGIEVVPPVRPGAVNGSAVSIGSAKFNAVLIPSSLRVGSANPGYTSSVSFDWTQTLRQYP